MRKDYSDRVKATESRNVRDAGQLEKINALDKSTQATCQPESIRFDDANNTIRVSESINNKNADDVMT